MVKPKINLHLITNISKFAGRYRQYTKLNYPAALFAQYTVEISELRILL